MSMKRKCYFCGKPVDIRRRMELFCSPRCEAMEKTLSAAPPPLHPASHPREDAAGLSGMAREKRSC